MSLVLNTICLQSKRNCSGGSETSPWEDRGREHRPPDILGHPDSRVPRGAPASLLPRGTLTMEDPAHAHPGLHEPISWKFHFCAYTLEGYWQQGQKAGFVETNRLQIQKMNPERTLAGLPA